MRNEIEESVMATPVSISKHSCTRRSVHEEPSRSLQASVVSQSPQAMKGKSFSSHFHPPSRKALKHPRWCNVADAEAMGSTLVRTTTGGHGSIHADSRTSRKREIVSQKRVMVIKRYRNLPLSILSRCKSFQKPQKLLKKKNEKTGSRSLYTRSSVGTKCVLRP